MKIPKFWSRATASGTTPAGREASFSCWRSSDVSAADAHESALAAARRALEGFLTGRAPERYPYGCRPMREEIVNQVCDPSGNLVAVVTRTLYGALVLNAERVMFADIDFPPVSTGEATRHFFARLFGRAKESPDAGRERQARQDVEQFIARHADWGLRLYRTCSGLRCIATHELFDATSPAALDALREMNSDPLYVRLCKGQECFRARLTPKPWRCGHRANRIPYPMEDDETARRYEQWKTAYETRQARYATCRFLGQLGTGVVHPEAAAVIDLHDFVTRSSEPLPLA